MVHPAGASTEECGEQCGEACGLKILLDARAVATPLHGIARYGWNLIKTYATLSLPHDFHVILGPGGQVEEWRAPSNFTFEQARVPPYGVAEQLRMPAVLARTECDLQHTLTYTAPLRSPHPLILSIFDLIHLRYPRDYSWVHPLYYRFVVRPLVQRARAIVTLSEASKRDVVDLLGANPEKVHVTPLAPDARFGPPPAEEIARVTAAYNLKPGFLLHLSNYRSHKNAEGVVRAYARLRHASGLKAALVLGGDPPPRFRRWLAKSGLGAGIQMLGHIPDHDLPALYGAASLFVFPSHCEGFGLPPLEAMACGTPVVASHASSLPEVLGQAALLVDPDDDEAIAEGVERILSSSDLSTELAARGVERAGTFSWDRVARETLAVYEEACGH
jgi:alpha-1,3-rhamnosyl/mannosyltransferase